MQLNRFLKVEYLPLPLIALMVATRYHHFGDAIQLPDASLAVFFFAGFYHSRFFPVFLMALAALIDYLAISNGTSSWCVTPAYVFLIPTYATLWIAGRLCSHLFEHKGASWMPLLLSLCTLFIATSIAFLISNGSFYWLSGRYPDTSWAQYSERMIRYYPSYLKYTLIYGISGFALIKVLKALITTADTQKAA